MRLRDLIEGKAAIYPRSDEPRSNARGKETLRARQGLRIVSHLGIVIAAQGQVPAQGNFQRKGRRLITERTVNNDGAARAGCLSDLGDLRTTDRIEGRVDPVRGCSCHALRKPLSFRHDHGFRTGFQHRQAQVFVQHGANRARTCGAADLDRG